MDTKVKVVRVRGTGGVWKSFVWKDESEETTREAEHLALYPLSFHNELSFPKRGGQWRESVNSRCSMDFNDTCYSTDPDRVLFDHSQWMSLHNCQRSLPALGSRKLSECLHHGCVKKEEYCQPDSARQELDGQRIATRGDFCAVVSGVAKAQLQDNLGSS